MRGRPSGLERSDRRWAAVDPSDDRGSITPLIVFYGMLALVVVLIVVAATSLYLERKRLFTLADGAALAGAESFDLADVNVTDGSAHPRLTNSDVAAAVDGYLRDAAPQTVDGLKVERAETRDSRSATVTLSGYWRPAVLTLFIPDGLRLDVTAHARSVFQ